MLFGAPLETWGKQGKPARRKTGIISLIQGRAILLLAVTGLALVGIKATESVFHEHHIRWADLFGNVDHNEGHNVGRDLDVAQHLIYESGLVVPIRGSEFIVHTPDYEGDNVFSHANGSWGESRSLWDCIFCGVNTGLGNSETDALRFIGIAGENDQRQNVLLFIVSRTNVFTGHGITQLSLMFHGFTKKAVFRWKEHFVRNDYASSHGMPDILDMSTERQFGSPIIAEIEAPRIWREINFQPWTVRGLQLTLCCRDSLIGSGELPEEQFGGSYTNKNQQSSEDNDPPIRIPKPFLGYCLLVVGACMDVAAALNIWIGPKNRWQVWWLAQSAALLIASIFVISHAIDLIVG